MTAPGGHPPGPPDPDQEEWATRLAGFLLHVPHRLRPAVSWLARQWVARFLGRATAGLLRVQIFDRAMNLAAQAFTSIFPLIILLGVVLKRVDGADLADYANLPPDSKKVVEDALESTGFGAFGVLGSLLVLLSSTGLARALGRAYAAVWVVRRVPTGPRAAWRWLAVVLLLATFVIGTRVMERLTTELPLPHVVTAAVLLVTDCGTALLMPVLLLGRTVPARMLVPGAVAFAFAMLALRPAAAVYLPSALATSADRYGTIGIAFTLIGWLYVVSFGVLLTAVVGHAVANDEGVLGRLARSG